MIDILERISTDLMIPRKNLELAVRLSKNRVRKIKIPKKDGGFRVAFQPAATLKPILAWLNINVIATLPVSQLALAFRPNVSILDNADLHKNSLYSIRMDLADFFPSIKSSDLRSTINRAGDLTPILANYKAALDLMESVCFDANSRLPIGFLTSPAIANAVLFEIDNALLNGISNTAIFGNSVLTRYADDFIFSSDKKGACKEFERELRKTLAHSTNPVLKVNEKKTRFMSRAGGSTLVTGLRINNQGHPIVHAMYRDHVRLLVKLFAEGRLKQDDVPRLVGHLAFVEHVDPSLFTRLSFKYYAEIERLRAPGHR